MAILDKLNYLSDTKALIKQKLNNIGSGITDEDTFRSYASKIDDIYNEWPKVTDEGTEITLANTKAGKMNIGLKGNTEQPFVLPLDYTALDYIESTGTQYIDTGIATSNTIKVEAEAVNTFGLYRAGRYYGGGLFGGRLSSTNSNFSYVTGDTHDYVGKGNNFIEIDKNTNTDLIKIQYDTSSVNIKCSNYEYINNNLLIDITNSFNIFVFAMNQNDNVTNYGTFKLYRFKMYDNNVLVRDFIPCKNGNNEIGLYDIVSNTFFANQGTNDFVAGNEVTKLIHVVTGNNTIRIGDTDYPINLGNIEVCKIGDYKDEIFINEPNNPHYDSSLVEGGWYKYEAINKSVLDGTEANWSLSDGTIVCQAISNYAISNNIPIINRFMGVINKNNGSTLLNNEACFNNNLNYNRFYIKSDKFESIGDFKTWLSTNNLIVYCIARNVATTQITDETLISQLDAIENAMSVSGTTTISQTNSDLPFILNVSALKDLSSEPTLLTNNINTLGTTNLSPKLELNSLDKQIVADEEITNTEIENTETTNIESGDVDE